MDIFIMSSLSVMLFCGCCYKLLSTILSPLPALNVEQRFSRAALRLQKNYSIFSWTVMTLSFLVALVISFYQVYTQL